MLSNSQISQYKIKKIVNYFAEDFTATDVAKHLKLNRNTINRYYHMLRKISLDIVMEILSTCPSDKIYIGYFKGEYGPQDYLNVYKINEKTFVLIKSKSIPVHKQRAIVDTDFNRFLGFLYNRFTKFHGLNGIGYYYQLYETSLRYNYSADELFTILWNKLRKSKLIS